MRELCADHNTFAILICCAPDDGLQRDKAIKRQEGFFGRVVLPYRLCHAGQGCGGTLPVDCGGTVSFSGIGVFRESVSKGYQSCVATQMHLVLAQYSRHPGSTSGIPNITAQVRKSIALALKEAHKQKNSVVVISSSMASSQ